VCEERIKSVPTFEFGNPEFSETIFNEFEKVLSLAVDSQNLADSVLEKVQERPAKATLDDVILSALGVITLSSWDELLVLVQNGFGHGAFKIARGMFETSVIAEYLRCHPKEIKDYFDFARVLTYKLSRARASNASEIGLDIITDFQEVKHRYANRKGSIRHQWHQHSLAHMAKAVNRSLEYERIYSHAAAIHHGSIVGLFSYSAREKEPFNIVLERPPSTELISDALSFGFSSVFSALLSLIAKNDLDFTRDLNDLVRKVVEAFKTMARRRNRLADIPDFFRPGITVGRCQRDAAKFVGRCGWTHRCGPRGFVLVPARPTETPRSLKFRAVPGFGKPQQRTGFTCLSGISLRVSGSPTLSKSTTCRTPVCFGGIFSQDADLKLDLKRDLKMKTTRPFWCASSRLRFVKLMLSHGVWELR
jgi:hypothetical protein